jgi:hypothetical protein
MESFAIAGVARAHDLPFIVVRAVLDTARDAVPPSVLRAAARGAPNAVRLLPELALAPREWLSLLRLARRLRCARRALQAVARVGVAASFAAAQTTPA